MVIRPEDIDIGEPGENRVNGDVTSWCSKVSIMKCWSSRRDSSGWSTVPTTHPKARVSDCRSALTTSTSWQNPIFPDRAQPGEDIPGLEAGAAGGLEEDSSGGAWT